MIERSIGERIEEATRHFPVTLLAGPRQVGKSTLLYHRFREKGYSYVSLDDRIDLGLAKSDPRSFLSRFNGPLIIDEAQAAPELFPEIERIVNESRLKNGSKESNGMFILSGSNKLDLLERSKESLAGRVAIIDMWPLSLSEIFGYKGLAFSLADSLILRSPAQKNGEEDIFRLIHRGFFPGLYDDYELNVNEFYSSYFSTYLMKDLREVLNVLDEARFIAFLRLLASNTAQELVYDTYAKHIGVSVNTIKSWVAALVKTGIVYLLRPYYEESFVKRIVKRPKLHFFDTGLATYLCGIDNGETLRTSFLKGRFFETFVVNEILKSYSNSGETAAFFYYRDSSQQEIDLLILRNGALSAVEVKSGTSFTPKDVLAFKNLACSKWANGGRAIICSSPKPSKLIDGTLIVPYGVI